MKGVRYRTAPNMCGKCGQCYTAYHLDDSRQTYGCARCKTTRFENGREGIIEVHGPKGRGKTIAAAVYDYTPFYTLQEIEDWVCWSFFIHRLTIAGIPRWALR